MHRLADLKSGIWQPSRELRPEALERIRALAEQIPSGVLASDRSAGVFFVPGRIEVLGKHTDYAGGRSLVTATEQGLWMVACQRQDCVISMIDRGRNQLGEFEIGADPDRSAEPWILYPKTVASRVAQRMDRDLVGADIVFENNLQASSGLSSSSVLVVGTFLALARCNHLDRDPRWRRELPTREDLAAFLGAVENGRAFGPFLAREGVGTRGGDQDHTAILCSGQGEIRQYRFLPTVRERILSMPSGFVFAVAVSGMRAEKIGTARDPYNRISNLAGRLEQLWQSNEGGTPVTLGSIVRETPQGAERLAEILESSVADPREQRDLRQRLSQFRQETEEIIPAAAEALGRRDLEGFGRCVDRSQALATELLGNQVDETVCLAASARDLGAVAASAFGAGFGGAVWAMVQHQGVEEFLEKWSAGYLTRFPERRSAAVFFWTRAGAPAVEL